jgi:hypothetical protein
MSLRQGNVLSMTEKVSLTLIESGQVSAMSDCVLTFKNDNPCTIDFLSTQLGSHIFKGEDLYEAFCELKKFLEGKGHNILCNGSRNNAFPSTMSRQMGGGEDLYILSMGEPASPDSFVYIFDPIEPSQAATLEEREEYYRRWLESTNGLG